jgi:hypothetical protein
LQYSFFSDTQNAPKKTTYLTDNAADAICSSRSLHPLTITKALVAPSRLHGKIKWVGYLDFVKGAVAQVEVVALDLLERQGKEEGVGAAGSKLDLGMKEIGMKRPVGM